MIDLLSPFSLPPLGFSIEAGMSQYVTAGGIVPESEWIILQGMSCA